MLFKQLALPIVARSDRSVGRLGFGYLKLWGIGCRGRVVPAPAAIVGVVEEPARAEAVEQLHITVPARVTAVTERVRRRPEGVFVQEASGVDFDQGGDVPVVTEQPARVQIGKQTEAVPRRRRRCPRSIRGAGGRSHRRRAGCARGDGTRSTTRPRS